MTDRKPDGPIANILARIINSAGFELHRLSASRTPALQLQKGLESFGIDTLIDIGANKGQFASGMRAAGYAGEIVSFEPQADAHTRLTAAAKRDRKWRVHRRCAIGDTDGETHINVSRNSLSSSLLPMLDAHVSAEAASAYVGREPVSLARIDAVVPPYLSERSRTFLKIDAQGFEWKILDGARETLPRVQGVLCELSLVPLYEGQRLWKDVIARLEAEGFTLWAIQRGFTNPQNGRTLQIDAIFFRLNSNPP